MPMILSSNTLGAWLAANDVALAMTTYQAGGLFLLSGRADGAVRANERRIDRCQGFWTDGDECWVSSRWMLWRFADDGVPGSADGAARERLFVPREGRVTGDLDVHDIAVGEVGGGQRGPIFVSTAYNCLATTSAHASFRPLWRPPFISELIAEDRCHLNGLAMDRDRPAYVTAVSRSDVADGWRERRRDGGVIVDVSTGRIVAQGLSMPHSGRGEFGWVDLDTGAFTAVTFCPGYARGLGFVGRHAVIGLSRPRRNQTFEGLELADRLLDKDAVPRCGLLLVDIDTGRVTDWLRFEERVDELYDVAVLPATRSAEAVGFAGEEIATRISIDRS
jgi:uncharacterized protein (TIGR03032 family)